ncbi:CD276 antigen isoform X2 [Lates calcarifer]|uniref:CD276 antigen isoform X2 n=1 Tax=Lates calcarifer TaxID=8187 RepID=A0A4W6FQI6_LATCA|nr:CD276 antigen isoform X2 [Lates calcarifer]
MASTGTLFLIFAVTFIREGNAQNTFVNVNCKENVGQYGQQSLLECIVQTTSEASDIQIRVVTWRRQGADKPALVFHDGRIDPKSSFTFAEPSWNNKNMNVSVLIPNTRVADNGRYTCMVMTNSGDGKGEVNLKVTAKYSEPIISSIPEKITPGSNGELTCETHGGYPKGDIRWFVNDNTDWTKSSKMEVKGAQDGLLHLSSKLPLLHGSIFSKYTCIVYNATGGKEAEAVFIPDPEVEGRKASNGSESTSKVVAPVVVIGSLIVGLLLALLVYRRRTRNGHTEVSNRDDEESGAQEMDGKQQNIV